MNRKKREQQILSAALKVFARQGYQKSSVSQIIEEANVARGTFYLYFKSKKELCLCLIDRFTGEILNSVGKINSLAVNPQLDKRTQYRELASQLISTLTRNKNLTRTILVKCSNWDDDYKDKLNLFFDQLTKTISNYLQTILTSSPLRNFPTEIIAKCMIGTIKENAINWSERDDLQLEPVIQTVMTYLLMTLKPTSLGLVYQPSQMQKNLRSSSNQGNFH
jgi:AcrR family transcriptional regulator